MSIIIGTLVYLLNIYENDYRIIINRILNKI